MDKKQESFARNALRRASYKWPPRYTVMKRARVDRGKYLCNGCEKIHPNKNIQLDHIKPVVDPKKGFEGLHIFAERLFVYESGFQVLCSECHLKKSLAEGVVRRKRKAK